MAVFETIANIVIARPKLVAIAILLAVMVSLFGMTAVTMETGSDTYLDKNTPQGVLFDKYERTFQSDNIILLIEGVDVASPEVVTYLDQLGKSIKTQPYVASFNSFAEVLRDENGLIPGTQAEIDKRLQNLPAKASSMFLPTREMTLASIGLEQGISDKAGQKALNSVKGIVKASNPPPGITVSVTGSTAFQQEMSAEMGASSMTLIMAAMVFMVITMGILFGYVSHRFLPVLIVAIGLLFTFGVMGLTGIRVNMAVIGAFPVLIGLGIDYAIQFHSRLEEEARKSGLEEAVRTTITRTGPAVFYAMVATSMGFFAMFISDVPMIRSFGLVSMLGIALCYVASLLVIPTIALLIHYKPRKVSNTGFWAIYEAVLSDTAAKIAKKPAPILVVAGLVAVGGIYADGLIPIDTDENAFVPSDMPALLTINKVTDAIGSTDTFPVYLAGSGVTSPEAIQWMNEFGDAEKRRHDEIIGVTSIGSLISDYNGGVTPVNQAGIDEVLGRIPVSVKGRYLGGLNDGVVEFTTKDMEMSERADFKDKIVRDLASDKPPVSISATVTGNADLFTSLINNLSKSKEMMTYTGFVLIFLVLLIIYRRPTAASPIIPIVLVVGWNAVAMIALGINYTPLTATLGSMTIGVAAEYTILIMERYLEEREMTDDPVEAIRMSVRRIGSAITVSGLATFFGFSALILSSFNIISNFGLSTIVAVGFSLLSAILIMPAVIPIVDHASTWLKSHLPSRRRMGA